MRHTIQAISAVPTAPRIVLDVSSEPASLAANETLSSIMTAAGQIKFPSTQNPSTDVNTLDDYEEGTFTPTLSGATVAGVGTYSVRTGSYTKIGNFVIFQLRTTWSAHSGSGAMIMTGIPFTSTNLGACAVYWSGITYTSTPMALFDPSAPRILFRQAASNAAITDINIEAAGDWIITGTYTI